MDDIIRRGAIDAMTDIAHILRLAGVTDLVGLPEKGKKSIPRWGAATYNALEPANEPGAGAVPQIHELHQFWRAEAVVPARMKLDGWADRIYQAADRGDVPHDQCQGMMCECIVLILDTTSLARHLLYLLGKNPDQWDLLKQNRALLPSAINEALRVESPIRFFSRYVRAASQFGDGTIPERDRLLVFYASANQDERKWAAPKRFDITRKHVENVAFGSGIHTCAGMHLAKLEITCMLNAMLDRIDHYEVEEPTVSWNNLLRGYESLPMTVYPAQTTPN